MSCKTCKFYDPYDKVVHYYVHTEWPQVDPEDWCGQGRERESGKAFVMGRPDPSKETHNG